MIEQEYIMIHKNYKTASHGLEGRHYCGTQLNCIERTIAEEHLTACLKARGKSEEVATTFLLSIYVLN